MKLIVTEFVTLDGVMEAPGGEPTHRHTGWVGDFMGPQELQFKLDEVLEAEAHLLGRVTYESFAGAWPEREGPLADKINRMPKYVVSTTLRHLEWDEQHAHRPRRRRRDPGAQAGARAGRCWSPAAARSCTR